MIKINAKSIWDVKNLPNAITGIGIKLDFVLLSVVIFHREWISTITLLVGGILLTDFLDGKAARYFNAVSKLGAALDRFRDKHLQFTMFYFFLSDPRIHPMLKGATIPLIIVEILLLTIWFMGVRRKLNVSAGIWGKYKMGLMSTGILACPVLILIKEHKIKVPFFTNHIVFLIFIVSLFLAIMSFKNHVAKYRKQLKVGGGLCQNSGTRH